ncbi:class I SAM-dependent methyltransferase [Breoghania sp.]|uniref:class I SAM-dependent methyltransferase n=1 Tax=Breoghania sp. TaxID=2065378 RepID=UPI00260DDE4A|nr:class I SAM-dependent methyltransferase [Breoghania sp.]MDJ0932528.1 methyltransferase domain-containing protein [Breoghania sp.]
MKLNGFRIEPGEIEKVLDRLEHVEQSVVKLAETDDGQKYLAAYVVRGDEKRGDTAAADADVGTWGAVWDAAYKVQQEAGAAQGTGYTSTLTGQAIPDEAVSAWAEVTADRVMRFQPESVLDVGCGVELLGENLLRRDVERYRGCDLSATAVKTAKERLERMFGPSSRWDAACLSADQIHPGRLGTFDVVLLNSVVQYFPDRAYLARVLEQAVACCGSNGRVVVGDVPAASMKDLIAVTTFAFGEEEAAGEEDIERRARAIGAGELWLDPGDFYALAAEVDRACAVEADLRLGEGEEEMTRYRYDVILAS